MAITPQFATTPKISWATTLTTGTNTYDGTTGTVLLCTAGASGSYLKSIELEALGTNVTSNIRIFVNNGSAVGTATNNSLLMQYTLPSTTASATSATIHISIPMNIALPAGFTIYVVLSTTVAAGWRATALLGDY